MPHVKNIGDYSIEYIAPNPEAPGAVKDEGKYRLKVRTWQKTKDGHPVKHNERPHWRRVGTFDSVAACEEEIRKNGAV